MDAQINIARHETRSPSAWLRGQEKRRRPLEILRPDVVAKRAAFLDAVSRIPVDRLVFIDDSGMNTTMGRSHAWVKKGEEYIDFKPMNRGKGLTLLGAIRRAGWVLLSTMWLTVNADRFVAWLRGKLLRELDDGDALIMDNLAPHHDVRVALALSAASGSCTCRHTHRTSSKCPLNRVKPTPAQSTAR